MDMLDNTVLNVVHSHCVKIKSLYFNQKRKNCMMNSKGFWIWSPMASVDVWTISAALWILARVLLAHPNTRIESPLQWTQVNTWVQLCCSHKYLCQHFERLLYLAFLSDRAYYLVFSICLTRSRNAVQPIGQHSEPTARWPASLSSIITRITEGK